MIATPDKNGATAIAAPARARWAGYAGLVRFPYHVTFVSVVAGAVAAAGRFDPALLGPLVLLYVTFNVLLYGGIYTANAIADLESDAAHPRKRARPLPSGDVGVGAAAAFGVGMTSAGLLGGYLLFERRVFLVFLAALAVNAAYTFWARDVSYLELAGNSATHPLRFVMGVCLAGGAVPALFVLAFFLFGIGASAARRMVEKQTCGWKARRTLAAYTPQGFLVLRLACFAGIVALALADSAERWPSYAVLLVAYAVGILGFERLGLLRRYYEWVWTR